MLMGCVCVCERNNSKVCGRVSDLDLTKFSGSIDYFCVQFADCHTLGLSVISYSFVCCSFELSYYQCSVLPPVEQRWTRTTWYKDNIIHWFGLYSGSGSEKQGFFWGDLGLLVGFR